MGAENQFIIFCLGVGSEVKGARAHGSANDIFLLLSECGAGRCTGPQNKILLIISGVGGWSTAARNGAQNEL